MSLRPRHGYPAALHRGLRLNHPSISPEFPAVTVVTDGCAPLPAHIRQVRGRFGLERFSGAGSSRTPLRHACRTRTVWQYQHAPALSGLLPPSPAPPGSGCPQLRLPAATETAAAVSHLRSNRQRLTAQAYAAPRVHHRGARCRGSVAGRTRSRLPCRPADHDPLRPRPGVPGPARYLHSRRVRRWSSTLTPVTWQRPARRAWCTPGGTDSETQNRDTRRGFGDRAGCPQAQAAMRHFTGCGPAIRDQWG